MTSLKFSDGSDPVERDSRSLDTATNAGGKSRTIQSQAEDADINTIVRRFGLTGELPVARRVPLDIQHFDADVDYRDCLEAVRAADSSFSSLPAEVRARFENDPARFVDFATDPKNLDQMRSWGLAPAAPVAAPEGAGGAPG